MKRLLILSALLATGLATQAQTVLIDTFDVPTGTFQEFNLQSNQAVRQAGSAVSATYTNLGSTILGATQEYLTQTEAYETNGVLNLRALCNGEGSPSIAAASVAINEDLASSLAGKHYQISYTGNMIDRIGNVSTNSPDLVSWYQGISLGGTNVPPREPTWTDVDTGFLMRSDGIAQIWGDGLLLSAVTVSNFTLLEPYTVFIDINESNSTVKATVACAGVFTDMPLAPVTFEVGDNSRRLQLINRIHVDGLNITNDWDAWTDAQFNDLKIEPITAPPDYVVADNFVVPAGTDQEFDLDANQLLRQLGSTANVTYTNVGAGIIGGFQEFLTQTEAYDGSGVLNLRGLIDAVGQVQIAAPSAGINEDLSPWLSGESYAVSYTGIMIDRFTNTTGNADVESWYQSVTLGGGPGLPGELTSPNADLGFAMYNNNVGVIYADGVLQYAALVPGVALGSPYSVQIEVDEVAQTAAVSIDAGGIVTDMGTYTNIYDAGETARRMQLVNRIVLYDTFPQGSGGWDVQVDAQINDLQVSIIRDKSYETWVEVDTGLTEGVNDARTDDPDSDGMDNLLEYVLGGNPLVDDADSILPEFSLPDSATVEYVYRRRSDAYERGLVYDVYFNAAGLQSPWNNVSNSLETASGAIDTGFESVTNELDITSMPLSFLNLKVTEN